MRGRRHVRCRSIGNWEIVGINSGNNTVVLWSRSFRYSAAVSAIGTHSARNKMKTTNRPKKDSLPVVKPPQPKTSAERFAQQRRIHLKLKAKLKAQPKTVTPGISPRLLAISSTRKLPTEVAEPKLIPTVIQCLQFATKCMERKDWSPNQRRLAAFYHLQKDPLTATLNPDQLPS
jgi:hypothetical protein